MCVCVFFFFFFLGGGAGGGGGFNGLGAKGLVVVSGKSGFLHSWGLHSGYSRDPF